MRLGQPNNPKYTYLRPKERTGFTSKQREGLMMMMMMMMMIGGGDDDDDDNVPNENENGWQTCTCPQTMDHGGLNPSLPKGKGRYNGITLKVSRNWTFVLFAYSLLKPKNQLTQISFRDLPVLVNFKRIKRHIGMTHPFAITTKIKKCMFDFEGKPGSCVFLSCPWQYEQES